jgi:hypothetical protein
MPQRTAASPFLRSLLGTALVLGAAMSLTLPSVPQARQQRNLAGLDLKVRPGDVAAGPAAAASVLGEPAARVAASPFDTPEAVAEADRVPRAEIPNRRRGSDGNSFADSGVLQDLLENKTIPLFRVTVEPPF